MDSDVSTRGMRIFTAVAAGALVFFFLIQAVPYAFSAIPENDLWWMMPTMSASVSGKPAAEVASFLLGPAPLMLGQPVLKLFLWLGHAPVEWGLRHLILLSVFIHLLNGLQIVWLGRLLGLNSRVSLLSALMYVTLFAQFHAVLWPTAFQHVAALFTILGMLNLYLKTEQLRSKGKRSGMWWMATLVVGGLASLQRSALMAPVLILFHILLLAYNHAQDRTDRFNRWLPLFVLSLIYPILAFTFVGDPIFHAAFASSQLEGILKAAILLGAGVGLLFAIRAVLRQWPLGRFQTGLLQGFLGLSLLASVLFWVLQDTRQLLLPYNALVPLTTLFHSYLEPIRSALAIDSTRAYHLLSPHVSFLMVLLPIIWLGAFWLLFGRRNRSLSILFLWYGIATIYLLRTYSSFPVQIPSRYFIYLSPVFALIFCSVLDRGVGALLRNFRWEAWGKTLVMTALIVGLGALNASAIPLALLRGRMANTYPIYDDIRTARLIQEDLTRRDLQRALKPREIAITGLIPLESEHLWQFAPIDSSRNEPFRHLFAEVMHNPTMRHVQIGPAPSAEAKVRYLLKGERLQTRAGHDLDPFVQLFEQGVSHMQRGRWKQAQQILEKASQTQPFLLRYLLGPYPLEDLDWVTQGQDLESWVQAIAERSLGASLPSSAKRARIASLIKREVNDYLLCRFYLAYSEHRLLKSGSAGSFLTAVAPLEGNRQRLLARIRAGMSLRQVPELAAFLNMLETSPPASSFKLEGESDYRFGRFLVRYLFHWDIQPGGPGKGLRLQPLNLSSVRSYARGGN